MRRIVIPGLISLLLVLMLFAGCFSSGLAEVEFDPLDAFRGRIGDIGFALPGLPCVFRGVDVDAYFTDSVQLFGQCGLDGCEFQVCSADITPRIEAQKADHPERSGAENEKNALFDFMTFYVYFYDGVIGQVTADDESGMIIFDYTFPDSPGSTYTAKGFLRGSQAVSLFIENCSHSEKALSLLAPLTDEQRNAFLHQTPVFEDMMGITMAFPNEPYVFTDSEGNVMALCFTKDFTRVVAQYIPIGLTLSGEADDEMKEMMNDLAKRAAATLGEEAPEIRNGVLSGSEELRQYDFTFDSSLGFGPAAEERWLGRVYAGEGGIWYLLATDSSSGRGFMDSCSLSDDSAEPSYSGLWIQAEMALAKDRTPGNAPSALRQFIRDLYHILDKGVYRDIISPDDIEVGDAIYADGHWIRTLTIGSSDLYALLLMSSDQATAVIDEIHVICVEDIDYRYGSYFTACCIKAAEGSEADDMLDQFANRAEPDLSFRWTGTRYQADFRYMDRSDFHYYLTTVTAAAPVQVVPMSEDWSADGLSGYSPVTAQEFFEGWEKFNQLYAGSFPLEMVDEAATGADGTEMYSGVFGDSTYVVLICNPDGKHVIDRVQFFNFEQFPPQTLLGGLFSLGIMTGMPEDQFVKMLLMLQEYPLWEDLLNMYPVAAWNGKMLLMNEDEYEGMYIPAGMIATFNQE